jgi:ketosteroid isomerase-like protein
MTKELIDTFYNAFVAGDGEAMVACYADDIIFEDPVFGELHGADAGDMWRMLCENATDLRIEHKVLDVSDTAATVNWIADYTFSATGRSVRNDVTAKLQFKDGKIVDHRDSFSIWKWSSQALGVPGKLLGWSPPLKSKVRKMAKGNLAAFQAKK